LREKLDLAEEISANLKWERNQSPIGD
jgi:hypothetical protein